MKRLAWTGLAICGAGLIAYLAFGSKHPPLDQATDSLPVQAAELGSKISKQPTSDSHDPMVPAETTPAPGPVQAPPSGIAVSALASTPGDASPAATGGSFDPAPATTLEHVRILITQYRSMLGENPVGTNEEITQALQGHNTKQINFLTADTNSISAEGELVDAWGSPYFFHQLSAKEMEIRSAGPDKVMWTSDDLIIR